MSGLSALLRRRTPSPGQNVEFFKYLRSDGYAYITTDYKPQSYDEIEFSFFKEVHDSQMILGARDTDRALLILSTSNVVYYSMFAQAVEEFGPPYNLALTKVRMYNEYSDAFWRVFVYGSKEVVRVRVTSTSPLELTSNLRLFACNETGKDSVDARIMKGFLSEVIIKRDNIIIHHFTPCSIAGVIGMYDQVTGVMYENANTTGVFSLSNVIEL